MRIEAYNQVAQVYQANKAQGTQKASGIGTSRDEVQISSLGRDYQIAKQAVAEASDIREDKVAQIAARVQSGKYDVNAADFASRLLERYNALTV